MKLFKKKNAFTRVLDGLMFSCMFKLRISFNTFSLVFNKFNIRIRYSLIEILFRRVTK